MTPLLSNQAQINQLLESTCIFMADFLLIVKQRATIYKGMRLPMLLTASIQLLGRGGQILAIIGL